MHLTQGALFWGMDLEFVKTATDLAVNSSHKKGDKIFNVGDPAEYFYMLLKGSVLMERGKDQLYRVTHPGEIFGWSSLICCKDYVATATCCTDAELLKIERTPFLALLEEVPKNKAILFQGLSKMLGNQLLTVYGSDIC